MGLTRRGFLKRALGLVAVAAVPLPAAPEPPVAEFVPDFEWDDDHALHLAIHRKAYLALTIANRHYLMTSDATYAVGQQFELPGVEAPWV